MSNTYAIHLFPDLIEGLALFPWTTSFIAWFVWNYSKYPYLEQRTLVHCILDCGMWLISREVN